MLKRLIKKLRRSEKGQAMVEMALVLPILILIIGGIVDFGWLFYNKLALNNAAREGARYAAIHYHLSTDWNAQAVQLMQNVYVGTNFSQAIVYDPASAQIQAQISANVPVLTGITSTILGRDTIEMTGTCIMRLEN